MSSNQNSQIKAEIVAILLSGDNDDSICDTISDALSAYFEQVDLGMRSNSRRFFVGVTDEELLDALTLNQ